MEIYTPAEACDYKNLNYEKVLGGRWEGVYAVIDYETRLNQNCGILIYKLENSF